MQSSVITTVDYKTKSTQHGRALKMRAGERVWSVKCLLYKQKDPSSILRTHVRKLGTIACIYNLSAREAEGGRCQGSFTSQSSYLVSSKLVRDPMWWLKWEMFLLGPSVWTPAPTSPQLLVLFGKGGGRCTLAGGSLPLGKVLRVHSLVLPVT